MTGIQANAIKLVDIAGVDDGIKGSANLIFGSIPALGSNKYKTSVFFWVLGVFIGKCFEMIISWIDVLVTFIIISDFTNYRNMVLRDMFFIVADTSESQVKMLSD